MTAGLILALLYLGRSVLIPLALAIMLSLLVAPLVRALRRLRVGRTSSVLIAVVALTVSCMGIAAALGTQILHIAESLPQYESNVQRKLKTLEEVTIGPLLRFTDETSRLTEIREPAEPPPVPARDAERSRPAAVPGVAVLEPPQFGSQPLQLVWKLLTTVWRPVQFAGIVLLVLIFVLLEHESLRDRFIRIAGATDIRSATLALNDAGDRLSRYFVSQFAVNLAFGLAIWMSLSMLRLPQALLCGILAGVMRFVPYVGVAIAALFAAVLALAVDPGWSLALSGLGRVHPARHRRGTVGGTTPVWSRHGAVAALGSGGSNILELALGSGRADPVHANHRVPAGCGASHEGAWRPRAATGQCDAAVGASEVSRTGAAFRRSPRDHGCGR